MAGTTELARARSRRVAELPVGAPRRIVADQLAWAAWYTMALAWLQLLPAARPALAVGIALGVAVVGVRPKALFLAPALVAATLGVALAAEGLGISPVLAAGAMAGALATWLRREEGSPSDWVDLLNGAMATSAGAGLGAWLASALGVHAPVGAAAVVGLASAQGLLPAYIRWRMMGGVPSARQVRQGLAESYRPPVFRALELHAHFRQQAVEQKTFDGLTEVVGWVYDLAHTLQTLDRELGAVDAKDLEERIELSLMEVEETEDSFTRERRLATVSHLKQLLAHAEQIRLERQRSESLQEYALAYLEEARLGLVLARALPGEATPQNLGEVLTRLRSHAREGEARRRTVREVGTL
ncbi:MAG: hypothetical protein H6741_04000 [Alphaproteobacteria bacterium]|nr:hypothetical protein [Alphaproteobacteria bacterium]MCB9791869.1 hypothetical protein [Alphaproteobacteria bacterium]